MKQKSKFSRICFIKCVGINVSYTLSGRGIITVSLMSEWVGKIGCKRVNTCKERVGSIE